MKNTYNLYKIFNEGNESYNLKKISCHKFRCSPCLKQIVCRSRDRIYHPHCNAKCLIEHLSDGYLPFHMNLTFFFLFIYFLIAEYPLLSIYSSNKIF